MKLEALATAVVAAIVVAIGAVPIYAGGSLIYERIAYGSAASSASADVVSADRLWLRELISPFKRERWEVTYEFKTAKGAVVRSTGIYTQSTATTKPEPGRKLRVLYLPDDPTSSYLEDQHKLFDAVWYIGLGLFVWFVAGGFVWWEIRQARKKQ
ncbi:MAG: DUF3592 domain-containing protein [Betaproteobacteria bacterium]|nr:DUF3592 domain-containing protein [Betaproteobacteria bacterium]